MTEQFDQSKVKEFEKEYSEVLQALFTKHGLAIVYEPQLRQSKDTGVWGVMTDAELADLGITSARLTAYVALMTQFTRLMSNQAVTTINGRAASDGIRNV